ncbi:nickel-dependent hydrogenase large subunit [Clostridium sp. AL.422]|uniref:nickel-dependent hydrogenase large subunit n=1 Tax=Clostridium TaxID=1485 RepID=UPI00293DE337|nr:MULTISPECIES: nickel-dependent hydrogenase large subunit [unclassified Clostridium]MDV4150229.1 nickel-dependent hydrogenase large subunit [Clostridium sp. AL.422]
MVKRITIDPVTRISGFLEVKAEVEKDIIVKANASGLLFRGFEEMLKGRPALDAIYFTERICGICSAAHSMASTLALEDALNIQGSLNDSYIRDIMHGFEFIQNHLRHFYLLSIPSYVRISSVKLAGNSQYNDFRLPQKISNIIEEHYIKSIELSRLAHEGLAVLGGKAPHNHGIFVGGVTVNIDSYKLEKVKSILRKINNFVSNEMVEDVEIIARYYPDYFEKGISYPNFMSFGVFDKYKDSDITYVKPGIIIDNITHILEPNKITEQVRYSWYKKEQNIEEVDLAKVDAYTFVKTPRYDGLPMEVGPLARLIIAGEYPKKHSCMDRNIARVLETKKISNILINLAERVEIKPNNQKVYQVPDKAYGVGLIDTTRGALGHWIEIENQVIKHYNIITPTVWNLSPKDELNNPGPIERALIGCKINNINEPIEIGRVVRSYDPCVSCATHLIGSKGDIKTIEVLI